LVLLKVPLLYRLEYAVVSTQLYEFIIKMKVVSTLVHSI